MRKLTDKVTFRHGATITTRTAQSPMLTNSGVDEFVSDDTLNYYADRSAHCILSFVILQLMEYTIYDYLIAIHSE